MARFIPHGATVRRVAPGLLAIVLAFGALGAAAQAQNQLQLFLLAMDASGKPVTDLKAEEIAFSESGMPGKVATFERYNLPIKLTIVVDNGPDSERALEFIRVGLEGLVDALPADMEIGLITAAPQPRNAVRPTTNHDELKKGFGRMGRDSESGRFSDSVVEYSQRITREARDKKNLSPLGTLNYLPVIVMVATIGGDATSYQLPDIDEAIQNAAKVGVRGFVVTTTSRQNDTDALRDLKEGRQAIIGQRLTALTRGMFEAVPDPRNLPPVLANWGKLIAESHTKQTSQYRMVLERPAGAPKELNPQNLDLRVTRPGIQGAVSGNGMF